MPEDGEPDRSVGLALRRAREARGLSRAALGGLVGRSAEWVKAIESGRLQPPRLPMLAQLARVLRVSDLSALTGSPVAASVALETIGHAATPAVEKALLTYPTRRDAKPVMVDVLEERVRDAWRARHASPQHRTTIGALLPALITDAQYTAHVEEGDERRRAQAVLAEVYGLAQFFLAYQPSARLVWLVADRAMTSGQRADHPMALATGAWALAQVLRESGELDRATEVVADATDGIGGHLASTEGLGMYGSLTFDLGMTAATRGEYGTAWRHWDTASDVASRLGPDYYHRMTSFSQVVLDVHAVTLDVELARYGDAIRRAESFDPAIIPSRPRRARHLIEVARAYHGARQKVGALHLLRKAYDVAPETIRYNVYAREITSNLVRSGGSSVREDARDLAAKLDLVR